MANDIASQARDPEIDSHQHQKNPWNIWRHLMEYIMFSCNLCCRLIFLHGRSRTYRTSLGAGPVGRISFNLYFDCINCMRYVTSDLINEYTLYLSQNLYFQDLGKKDCQDSCQESWKELLPRSRQEFFNGTQLPRILGSNSCQDLGKIIGKNLTWQDLAKIPAKIPAEIYSWQDLGKILVKILSWQDLTWQDLVKNLVKILLRSWQKLILEQS